MNVVMLTRPFSKLRAYEFSSNQLIIICCIYLTMVCNLPFLLLSMRAVVSLSSFSSVFLLSIPVLLVALMVLINGAFGIGKLLKPLLMLSVLVSSVLLYATASFGVVFDYDMIENGVQSDSAEMLSYVNLYSIAFISLLGLVPATLIYHAKVKAQPLKKACMSRLKLLAVNSVVVVVIAGFFYADYASVGRNNHELLGYITPYKFVDASIKYANRHYFSTPLAFKILDNMPIIQSDNGESKVTVLVIGETARAQNFSLNGYSQNTNMYTEKLGVVSFSEVSSCGTATAVSLPCMFSRLDRNNYDNRHANAQQNLLDIASMAGMDVLWIDNNNGSCKGVCARVNSIYIATSSANPFCDGEYCFDEALLAPLEHKLNHLDAKHTLIVVHMIGSHGPTYYRRYPQDKRHFLPDCQRSDIQHCTVEQIVNTYDNTIAYTDFVLSEVIKRLQNIESTQAVKASMLYVSDHGESLGEKGVFLHGLPYAFAPQEQTHVPMLFWQSSITATNEVSCMQSAAKEVITHDNLFDIVLGVTSVTSTQYKANRDVLAKCRTSSEMVADTVLPAIE